MQEIFLGYADANSTEMNEHTAHPVVNLMEEQKTVY
jgi:CTP synthase